MKTGTQLSKGVFIATQLNSTQLNWASWTAYSQVSRVFVYDVTTYKLSQLLFTLSSWVELCRYKHPFTDVLLIDDTTSIAHLHFYARHSLVRGAYWDRPYTLQVDLSFGWV